MDNQQITGRTIVDMIDEWSANAQEWKRFKTAEFHRYLAMYHGLDNPSDPAQMAYMKQHASLERFSGWNTTEFVQWDDVRVLRFDNRERLLRGYGDKLVRRVVWLVPDKSTTKEG
jgi:hypothetical protein